MIVGGGPAGMYAAITAAKRGHRVTLLEKSDSMGGLLKFADRDTYKSDLKKFKNSLISRIGKLPIEVRTGTEAGEEWVEREDPDVLIVAVGSEPVIPDIAGISLTHVMHVPDTYWEPEKVGERVVIIGGGLAGCETGLHLAALGKSVTIVEMMDRLATDATESHRIALFGMMDGRVHYYSRTLCTRITPTGITASGGDGSDRLFEADTVVYAVGQKARPDAAFRLCQAASRQYFLIGDCVSPRKVKDAVHEGYHAAMDIH